jgi:hypothetical protein
MTGPFLRPFVSLRCQLCAQRSATLRTDCKATNLNRSHRPTQEQRAGISATSQNRGKNVGCCWGQGHGNRDYRALRASRLHRSPLSNHWTVAQWGGRNFQATTKNCPAQPVPGFCAHFGAWYTVAVADVARSFPSSARNQVFPCFGVYSRQSRKRSPGRK